MRLAFPDLEVTLMGTAREVEKVTQAENEAVGRDLGSKRAHAMK